MIERVARPAARILLIDDAGAVLLFRFDAGDRPPLWATPGGAVDPGESFAAAAARELFEETGLDLPCGEEVHRRQTEFVTLENVAVTADERYFLVRADNPVIDTDRHTPLERRVMQQWRWFDRAELGGWPEPIFPETLREILEQVDPR